MADTVGAASCLGHVDGGLGGQRAPQYVLLTPEDGEEEVGAGDQQRDAQGGQDPHPDAGAGQTGGRPRPLLALLGLHGRTGAQKLRGLQTVLNGSPRVSP